MSGRHQTTFGKFIRCYGSLFGATVLLSGFICVYVVLGIMPSRLAQWIIYYTLPICAVAWVQQDARLRRCTPCFDFGMFVLMIWWLAIPWYLIWTRGWRGLAVLGMFALLPVVPIAAAAVTAMAMNLFLR
jgi:hypothetical protein